MRDFFDKVMSNMGGTLNVRSPSQMFRSRMNGCVTRKTNMKFAGRLNGIRRSVSGDLKALAGGMTGVAPMARIGRDTGMMTLGGEMSAARFASSSRGAMVMRVAGVARLSKGRVTQGAAGQMIGGMAGSRGDGRGTGKTTW